MSLRFNWVSPLVVAGVSALGLHGAVWANPPDRLLPGVSGSVEIRGPSGHVNIRFGDEQRRAVREYYATGPRAGQCPPGLAKKNNGCLPPGQAKAWQIGQPLPRGVVVYPLPRDLERRLGPPPAGYQYVRVAADILMIAVGTSMVIDAIESLAGL